MHNIPQWYYDEMKPVGPDFSNPETVRHYDDFHARFRDFDQEADFIWAVLGLGAGDTVLDMGAGTGNFALRAARRCARVWAVDVSPAMLTRAREKAAAAGLANIEFRQGGFLTYEHSGPAPAAIISQAALHHLPDFWKLVGLRRMAAMLRPGARFLLMDVVFDFAIDDYARDFEETIARAHPETAAGYIRHFREEYSTLRWIMEGLLECAGFRIDRVERNGPTFAWFHCTRGDE
ncbi:MAG: methyltransferase domain-containing protein [bacterium]|nr:methyltransferase domain-containing protein [bacterium]